MNAIITFAHPLWLTALAIIPAIRWLHRWLMPAATINVSALFLWQGANDAADMGPDRKQPDASWRRRALIAACIILALAQPSWRAQQLPLTIWLDDTPSMFSIENGTDRIAMALAKLDAELLDSDARWSGITLRTLYGRELVSNYSTAAGYSPPVRPADTGTVPQLPAMTSAEGEHWLLTDGSSDAVRDWAATAAIKRLIAVGAATENSAITRLAARRSLATSGNLEVLVAISNAGLRDDTRAITLRIDKQPAEQIRMSLPAGKTQYWRIRIPAVAGTLTASLQAGDALVADDTLAIDAATLRAVAASVDAACGSGLQLAIQEHPSLRIVASDVAELTVTCPDATFASAPVLPGAHLRVLRAPSQRVTAAPVWSADRNLSQQLLLGDDDLKAAAWPEPIDSIATEVLLRSGDQALITRRSDPVGSQTIVDTVIDLTEPAFISKPEMPALVSVLVDLALNRSLLGETTGVFRDPGESIVIPRALVTDSERPVVSTIVSAIPFSRWFAAAAALLLLLDLLLLARRGLETRRA